MFTLFSQTVTASIVVSVSYVASIYLGVSITQIINRNDPTVIKQRMVRATLATIISLIFVPLFLVNGICSYTSYSQVVENMGLIPGLRNHEFHLSMLLDTLKVISKVFLLFLILFIGPLVEEISWFVYPQIDLLFWKQEVADYFAPNERIRVIRDLIFAPITEELVYTASISALFIPLLTSKNDYKVFILSSPLLFGIAHVHHGYILYHTRFNKKILPVFINVTFQLIYTSIFGMMTKFIFLRTGTIWACVVAHGFCNYMGVPVLSPQANKFDWKLAYWSLLILGATGFKKYLWVLTESPNGFI